MPFLGFGLRRGLASSHLPGRTGARPGGQDRADGQRQGPPVPPADDVVLGRRPSKGHHVGPPHGSLSCELSGSGSRRSKPPPIPVGDPVPRPPPKRRGDPPAAGPRAGLASANGPCPSEVSPRVDRSLSPGPGPPDVVLAAARPGTGARNHHESSTSGLCSRRGSVGARGLPDPLLGFSSSRASTLDAHGRTRSPGQPPSALLARPPRGRTSPAL